MTAEASPPVPWQVVAQNLPEHAGNAIHTDAGARAAGFPGALVAGVTTYAYLTHPIVAAWGLDWVASGGAEVRFRAPVLAGDVLTCDPQPVAGDSDEFTVGALAARAPAVVLAELTAHRRASPPPPRPVHGGAEVLPGLPVLLGDELGADYGLRAGDDLTVFVERGVVHPAVWPAIANRVTHAHLVRGPWIHLRSVVWHHRLAHVGEAAEVRAVVLRRYERGGERAVLDVRVTVASEPVATLEHEAIVRLPGADRLVGNGR